MAAWIPSILLFGLAGLAIRRGRRRLQFAREVRDRGDASMVWPVAVGRITSCAVCAHNDGEYEGFFTPEVSYAFAVNDVPRAGTMISLHCPGTTRKKATAIAAKYPVGSEVAVRYDPADPQFSVLETGPTGESRLRTEAVLDFAVAIALILVGIVVPVFRLF